MWSHPARGPSREKSSAKNHHHVARVFMLSPASGHTRLTSMHKPEQPQVHAVVASFQVLCGSPAQLHQHDTLSAAKTYRFVAQLQRRGGPGSGTQNGPWRNENEHPTTANVNTLEERTQTCEKCDRWRNIVDLQETDRNRKALNSQKHHRT